MWEMEALAYAAVAGLTLIEMIKAVERAAEITAVRSRRRGCPTFRTTVINCGRQCCHVWVDPRVR
jgi:hypothetical protein